MIRLRPSGADEVLIKRVRDWYEPGSGVFIAPQALFNPALLFTTGVNGAWYDPSDFSTLSQDAAGTLPVTAVEQPVGLMLDKSKGLVLGPELVTNGGFASNLTGWSQSTANYWTWVNGRAYHANSANYNDLFQNFTIFSKPVQIEFDYECLTAANTAQWFYINAAGVTKSFDSAGVPRLGSGAGKMRYVALDGIQRIGFARYSQAEFYIDNISVRELHGNHAFNSSGNSANFPVLSARYNLLTKTEDFSDAVWLKTAAGTGIVPSLVSGAVAPNGTNTATQVTFNTGAGVTLSDQSILNYYTASGASVGIQYKSVVFVKGSANDQILVRQQGASGYVKHTLTGGWDLLSQTETSVISAVSFEIGLRQAVNGTINSSITVSIWHPDLRVANDALNQPAYQRVNTDTDYDTVGFKPYLSFNGTNQWLQTNSIDFTYGDKMFVCAGVRILGGGSATKFLLESGSSDSFSTPNTFAVMHGYSSIEQYAFRTHGSGSAVDVLGAAAIPITNVVSGIGNISAPSAIIRLNCTQIAQSTATQGTGNYGNYPLYIGARAGSSYWFNGRLYGLVVAGKQASASEIGQTEAFTNQKTGAY